MTLLFTFNTISAALDFESSLQKRGVHCKVIPVPRSLSMDCGYSVIVEKDDEDCKEELFKTLAGHAVWTGVYRRVIEGQNEHYEPFSILGEES
ncbi:MAG: DUF3343 domain-containing protein [Synergistaceae bacterium]|jgi:hypothetical protein|nr:DUF3343 domain-containing protein [Synergistaceae bacterium]